MDRLCDRGCGRPATKFTTDEEQGEIGLCLSCHNGDDALCQCGCGEPAPIAKKNEFKRGRVKGQPMRFRSGHAMRVRGCKSYRARNVKGRSIVRVHVLVAEAALGRRLPKGAEVHHVDENRHNNANANLVICQDHTYHELLHIRALVVRAGGDPDSEYLCAACRRCRPFDQFYVRKKGPATGHRVSWCKECCRAVNRKRTTRAA